MKNYDDEIKEQLTPVDTEELYDQMLDECYGDFMNTYPASRTLQEVDPIAYNCGLNDYIDGLELYELDGEYYEQSEVDELIEELEDAEK